MAARSMPPTQLGVLGKLPAELRLDIFEQLDYPSAIYLAATNRHYRSTIDPPSLVSDDDKAAFLRRAEHFGQHEREGLACYGCHRVKKRSLFSAQMYATYDKPPHPAREKWTGESNYRRLYKPWQFCLACAQEPRVFPHGAESIHVYDADGKWFCDLCFRATTPWATGGMTRCERCEHCVAWFNGLRDPARSAVCPSCKGPLVS